MTHAHDLVARHAEFRAFVARRIADPDQADEVLQEAWVKGLEKLGSVRNPEAARAWFYRLLRNTITDRYRARGAEVARATEVEPADLAAAEPEAEERACGCLPGAIDALKPEYVDVLKAVEVRGVPLKAWAEGAGVTANNAAVRAFRARAALLKQMQRSCGSCADSHCRDCTCDHPPATLSGCGASS